MSSNKSQIIDTHTHLYDRVFTNDRTNVLINSRASGVIGIITVSESLKDAKTNLKLAEIHAEILPAAGLYPGIIDLKQAQQMEKFIEKHLNKLVAIGEVGLDHWIVKDEAEREIQHSIFQQFIDLSIGTELPLNVHSRSAGRHAIDMLLESNAEKVQMHAFDGKASHAMKAIEAGYFFSIPPSIVRSRQKQKLVKQLPLKSILLETDSPVLGPDPDKRNVPANIKIAAETIAEIKAIPIDQVLETALENTYCLYEKTKGFQKFISRIA